MQKKERQHWAKKSQEKKSKFKIKEIIRLTIIYKILMVIFVGVFGYVFIFSDFIKINNVGMQVEGKRILQEREIIATVNSELEGRYWGLIPRGNFIFFSFCKIENKLKNKFKKIKNIAIVKKFPNRIDILIEERNLILMLCSRGECYFIDENGFAYEKAGIDLTKVDQGEVIKLNDESGKEIRENDYVLLPSYVEFMISISDILKREANIEILNEYRTTSRISEEVVAQTKKGWDIYLSAKLPIEKSAQTLKILLNRHLFLRDLNELEYIDLRFENKVFYRRIGGVVQEEEAIKKEAEIEGLKNEKNKLNNNIGIEGDENVVDRID